MGGGEGGGAVPLASQVRRVEAVAMLRGCARMVRAVLVGVCLGVGDARLGVARWWLFGGSSHVAGDGCLVVVVVATRTRQRQKE